MCVSVCLRTNGRESSMADDTVLDAGRAADISAVCVVLCVCELSDFVSWRIEKKTSSGVAVHVDAIFSLRYVLQRLCDALINAYLNRSIRAINNWVVYWVGAGLCADAAWSRFICHIARTSHTSLSGVILHSHRSLHKQRFRACICDIHVCLLWAYEIMESRTL